MARRSRAAQSGRTKSAAKRVTTREFARRVGVSQPDVAKGMRTGRLSKSLKKDAQGRRYIADAELATQEWRANVAKPPPKPATDPKPATADPPPDVPTGPSPQPKTLAEASLAETIQRERKLRLENDAREGQLIEAGRARRESYESARTVRDAIMNIPDRLAGELAAETDVMRVFTRLDEELRAALVSLADLLDADPPEPDGDDGGEPAALAGVLHAQ